MTRILVTCLLAMPFPEIPQELPIKALKIKASVWAIITSHFSDQRWPVSAEGFVSFPRQKWYYIFLSSHCTVQWCISGAVVLETLTKHPFITKMDE